VLFRVSWPPIPIVILSWVWYYMSCCMNALLHDVTHLTPPLPSIPTEPAA
jgi:hypothetical protein